MFGHEKPVTMTDSPASHGASLKAAIFGLAMVLLPATAGASESAWDAIPSKKAPKLVTDGLAKLDHQALDKVFVKPGVNLASYGKVMLAPMDTAIERRSDEVLLSVRDRDHAFEYMTKRLGEALGPALVNEPGQGVLKLAITFTDYVPNRSYYAQKARGGGFVDRVYAVGRAAFQGTLTDSQTGEVVAVIADSDLGLPFQDNFNLFTIYGDVDHFSGRWAKKIAKLVTGDVAS